MHLAEVDQEPFGLASNSGHCRYTLAVNGCSLEIADIENQIKGLRTESLVKLKLPVIFFDSIVCDLGLIVNTFFDGVGTCSVLDCFRWMNC